MSESNIYHLCQQLRLLARAGVKLAADGRKFAGEINRKVESVRLQLEAILDRLLDGEQPTAEAQRHVAFCREVVSLNRSVIRQLESEFA